MVHMHMEMPVFSHGSRTQTSRRAVSAAACEACEPGQRNAAANLPLTGRRARPSDAARAAPCGAVAAGHTTGLQARRVRRDVAAELERADALLLGRDVLLLLLAPVAVEVPVVLVRLVLVVEPLRVVLELPRRVSARAARGTAARTRSRPLMPEFLPAAACWSLAFFIASSSAVFLSSRVRFHAAKLSGVTGVRFEPSLCRSVSRKSSSEIWLFRAASSSALRSDLSTKPGGRACRYLQSRPFGHSQNQPNLCGVSGCRKIGNRVCKLLRLDGLDEEFADDLCRRQRDVWAVEERRTSVVVRGLPCLDTMTVRSFSSSHLSMVSAHAGKQDVKDAAMKKYAPSSSFSSRSSPYRFRFSTFLPTSRSWLNLHLFPFSQCPLL
jgi:hypothetical protein